MKSKNIIWWVNKIFHMQNYPDFSYSHSSQFTVKFKDIQELLSSDSIKSFFRHSWRHPFQLDQVQTKTHLDMILFNNFSTLDQISKRWSKTHPYTKELLIWHVSSLQFDYQISHLNLWMYVEYCTQVSIKVLGRVLGLCHVKDKNYFLLVCLTSLIYLTKNVFC